MEISSIKLSYFRRFDHFKAIFTKGLNIVKGPNEAGKSSLQDAIVIGLFDRPTGKAKELIHQQWGRDRLYEIELTYRLDEGDEYTLQKDYQAQSMEISGPEGVDTTWSRIKSELERALGTSSEKLFLSTASIRQDAMAEIGEGRKEISTQLQRIVMGSEAEVEPILKKLKDRLADLERGLKTSAPVNPGVIKQWMDRLAALDQEIGEIKPAVQRIEDAQEEVSVFKDRQTDIEKELRTLEDLHQRFTRRRELSETLDEQRKVESELEGRLEKVQSASDAKVAAETELAKFTLITQFGEEQFSELEKSNENLKTRTTESRIREKDLRQLESVPEVPAEEKRRKPWIAALSSVGALLGLVGIILLQNTDSETLGLPLLIVGGVLAIGGFAWYSIINRRSLGGKEAFSLEREGAQDRYEEGIKGVEEAQRILNENLKLAGLTTWEEFQTSLDQVRTLESEINSAEVTLSALLAETETIDELVDKREAVSRERRDSQESLEDLADAPQLSAKEFQELVNKLDDLKEERENLRDQITRREVILQEPSHNLEDLHQLEERQASFQRNLEQNLEKADIYRFVLGGLETARQETLRTAKDELEPRLGAYLQQMTRGRYDTALVDDNLAIRIVHNAKEEPIEVEKLSRGTQDQVYLAARLAFSDLVFHEARPPLLMDDPFVTFDPQRKQAALEMCKSLAVDRQIILFTCHEGYDSFADHVIELE
jgi:uncharacterized protein YhaN